MEMTEINHSNAKFDENYKYKKQIILQYTFRFNLKIFCKYKMYFRRKNVICLIDGVGIF